MLTIGVCKLQLGAKVPIFKSVSRHFAYVAAVTDKDARCNGKIQRGLEAAKHAECSIGMCLICRGLCWQGLLSMAVPRVAQEMIFG